MDLLLDILKSFFHDQIAKIYSNTKQIFFAHLTPSIFLIVVGALFSSVIFSWINASRVESLENRISSQHEQLLLCRSQAQSALSEYTRDTQIKQSIIQLYTLLLSQNGVKAEKLLHSLHLHSNADPSPPLPSTQTKEQTDTPPTNTQNESFLDKIKNVVFSKPPRSGSFYPPEITSFTSSTLNSNKMTAKKLASCVLMAADTYKVPAAVLIGLIHVQKGHTGEDIKLQDGSDELGLLKIGSAIIPTLTKYWKVNGITVMRWLKDDACINIHVGAYILKQKIVDEGSLWGGITHFRYSDERKGEDFARAVVAAMDKQGLIKHDDAPPDSPQAPSSQ